MISKQTTSPRDLVAALKTALATEREALRKLDAKAVAEIAVEKQRLVTAIEGADAATKKALAKELGSIRDELRRNLILLAYARDYIRDAIAAVRPQGQAVGGRLSVEV